MAVSGNPNFLILPSFPAHAQCSSSPRTVLSAPSSTLVRLTHDNLRSRKSRCPVSRQSQVAEANQMAEGFIHTAVTMNFFERLSLAWRILFPSAAARRDSNASIAKQRLKMILFSDRCAVSDEAKQKIVSKIMGALSDFVEIDSEDNIQLSVSTDLDLGTVYSVTVPVRRVKPGYGDDEYRGITGVEYVDSGAEPGSVDVKFEFFVPGEHLS
ncbi:cell division topological specificity factor homolog, chloroplastic-like [Wolffia australiana]